MKSYVQFNRVEIPLFFFAQKSHPSMKHLGKEEKIRCFDLRCSKNKAVK